MPNRKSLKRKRIKASDKVEGFKSLRFQGKKYGVSPTTTFREVFEQTSKTPSWEQVTAYKNYSQIPGIKAASMDITWLGIIEGKARWALIVTDFLSSDIVVYQPVDNQKAHTLVEILERLKQTGYVPSIVVIDGAGALRKAIEEVYPDSEIQRCVIHLERNVHRSKDIKPRENKKTRKDGYTKKTLVQIQKQSLNAVFAWTKSRREIAMQKLQELTKQGGRPRVFLERLKKKMKYFHTFDEPLFAQFQKEMRIQWKTKKLTKKEQAKKEREIRSTNYTERMCGIIKELKRMMRGFKSVESALYLISERMLLKRVGDKEAEKLKRFLIKEQNFMPIAPYRMPPEPYCCSVTKLREVAKRYELPLELLISECKQLGLITYEEYALTPDVAAKVEVDHKAISKHRQGKSLRLKLDTFLTVDSLSAEHSSNLSGYCSFEKPTFTFRDFDRRALTRFNSEQHDHRVRIGNGLYSSLDIAKFLSYAKASEFDLHYSIHRIDPPLGIRAGDKKAIILPLKITGTDAQKAITETPTLQRLLDTFNINQRINVYAQKPFSLKEYGESKRAAKNMTPTPIRKTETVQLTMYGLPYTRFSLWEYARRKGKETGS